jgi:hypothetical protein
MKLRKLGYFASYVGYVILHPFIATCFFIVVILLDLREWKYEKSINRSNKNKF